MAKFRKKPVIVWVITEPDGEHHYPCKPEVFRSLYRPLGEDWDE